MGKINYRILRYDCLASTSDTLKELMERGVNDAVVLAKCQSKGRGRGDHSFVSPEGGLYFSLPLPFDIPDTVRITPAAAVAVRRALQRVTDRRLYIKWVNDIYTDKGKLSGILAERTKNGVILGVGINVLLSPLLPDMADGLVSSPSEAERLSDQILFDFLTELDILLYGTDREDLLIEYEKDSYLKNKRITVRGREAEYIGIDEDFRLSVRYGDGSEERVSSGEIGVIGTT